MPDGTLDSDPPAGSRFLRADLHVHSHPDGVIDPRPDLDAYVKAAVAAGVDLLAITDHNHGRFVRQALAAAETEPRLTVLPGVEISTNDGHLLAIFDPEKVSELEALVVGLQLTELSATEQRSKRSMLDLVTEIDRRGGLAIPAHVDTGNGMATRLRPGELAELLANPALAGLEFSKSEALQTWFTDEDEDEARRAAWQARSADPALRERGLARLMSSDAHSPEKVGKDRRSRTLTRLRLDDTNFSAVRNAVVFNPKARCKAEAVLPAAYPRIVEATFQGGFLDGVTMPFSPNLNCLIGGRGSGKSTALLAIRAALGAAIKGDDADAAERMPDRTCVRFLDSTGSLRTAVRVRGQQAVDEHGTPIRLRLADLGQDESGRLTRGYAEDPTPLLEFLDGFVVTHEHEEAEEDLQAKLTENALEVTRTSVREAQIEQFVGERDRLSASLDAAKESRVEAIARWAALLSAEGPLLEEIDRRLTAQINPTVSEPGIDLDRLAGSFGVDLRSPRVEGFVEGDGGLRDALVAFRAQATKINADAGAALREAAGPAEATLSTWRIEHADLQKRLLKRREELEAQGLRVQADAVSAYATRLRVVKEKIVGLQAQRAAHNAALVARGKLLEALIANRAALHQVRRATLKRIAGQANSYSGDLTIMVSFEAGGLRESWIERLTKFGFNRPRVQRLAEAITPQAFVAAWAAKPDELLALKDEVTGQPFFTTIPEGPSWQERFALETMRLDDRPRVEVRRRGDAERRSLDRLSAGQQCSVLLGLLLCAERSEPLIVDQPEDHLDGQYIASAVVSHLEGAKERRQVVLATHSANLVVLGDAEFVMPMQADSGNGAPADVGAVDNPATRDQICALLEGGRTAFRKRGQRYGLRFNDS